MADIAHIAGLVVAGLHPSPVPHCQFVTTTTHKTLRGPRGGMILCTAEWAEAIDKAVFPGVQGGPLMHVIAAKAVAFAEGAAAGVEGLPEADRRQRAGAVRGVRGARLADRLGGTDNHLFLIDLGPTSSRARRPSAGSAWPTSRSTRTRCRSTPASPTSPRPAHRHPAVTTRGMARTRWCRSPGSSTACCASTRTPRTQPRRPPSTPGSTSQGRGPRPHSRFRCIDAPALPGSGGWDLGIATEPVPVPETPLRRGAPWPEKRTGRVAVGNFGQRHAVGAGAGRRNSIAARMLFVECGSGPSGGRVG